MASSECTAARCANPPAVARKQCEHHINIQRRFRERQREACAAHGPGGSCGLCKKRANAKARYEANRRHMNTVTALRRFGLTIADFEGRLAAQAGVCAICTQECAHYSRLSVDHDHNSGKVRGLLCNNCNRALGMFKDNPAVLRSAADYLERAM